MKAAVVPFLLLLLLLRNSAATAENKNLTIPRSSKLIPGTNSSVWRSESGIFAFGFYGNLNGGYTVCIFVTGVLSRRPVVWTPANLDPILPDNILSLENNYHGLQLFHNRTGRKHVYSNVVTTKEAVAEASMLDNGNFVLYNSNGAVIWQSFDYPTDTLMPGQRLPTGQELVSRASETDLSKGKFRLKMQIDGNLVQYPVGTPDTAEDSYYESRTFGKGNNMSLNLDGDGRLYLYDGNSSYYDVTRPNGGEGGVYLARVDPDGIFRLYNRGQDGESTVRWLSTEDRCSPKGICGVNSFCTHTNETVSCTCLPGFGQGTCTEDFDVKECRKRNSSVRYEMMMVPNVTWKPNYYAVNETAGEEECGRACINDCDCVVALFSDGKCKKQRTPLKYGRKTAYRSYTAVVRVSLPALTPPPPPPPLEAPNASASASASGLGKRPTGLDEVRFHVRKFVIIGVSIGTAALVISLTIIYFRTKRRGFFSEDEKSKQNVNELVIDHGSLALKRYNYKEIKKITKLFMEKLGQGGYGSVYKGILPDGKLVAIKVLKETCNNGEEFINEVASISKTSHVNIVNLLGFCFEKKKRALVYEFMPNNSLDKYIYKDTGSAHAECSLEWNKLYEIAVGVARGLEYLHRGCNTRIVHFDIKPQNILLDQHFRPKISDFGLAKLCVKTQSAISMLGTRGTIGYIAPEVFSRNFGVVSHKSDVYSYGIMLLQMAEARINLEVKSFRSSDDGYFLEKIYEHVLVKNEKVYDMIRDEDEKTLRKMLIVGFWCIQTAPSDRPSMNKVVDMLEGNVENIQIPPLPFLLSSPKPQFSWLLPVIVEMQSSTDENV